MAQKRATFITNSNDERCDEVKRFIEENGVTLNVRDTSKNPLSMHELENLFGHIPITHFLNTASPGYKKNGLDKELPSREEIIRLMVEDVSLLRRPIIKTIRLITVGLDKKKIAEMLQFNHDKEGSSESQGRRIVRRPTTASSSGK